MSIRSCIRWKIFPDLAILASFSSRSSRTCFRITRCPAASESITRPNAPKGMMLTRSMRKKPVRYRFAILLLSVTHSPLPMSGSKYTKLKLTRMSRKNDTSTMQLKTKSPSTWSKWMLSLSVVRKLIANGVTSAV